MVSSATTLQELTANVRFDPDNEMNKPLPAGRGKRVTAAYALSKFMLNRSVQLLAQDAALRERRITVSWHLLCHPAQHQPKAEAGACGCRSMQSTQADAGAAAMH